MLIQSEVSKVTDLTASAQDVLTFDVKNLDVLAIDVGNTGSAAFTAFTVHERVSPNGPLRDITPSSFVVESSLVFTAAATAPGTLAAGGFSRFSLNVTDSAQIVLRATGSTGAQATINAAGYKVQA